MKSPGGKFLFGLICGLIFLPQRGWSQVPYLGGAGDGYHGQYYVYLKGDVLPADQVDLYPNPILRGATLQLRAEGVRNKIEILIYTLQGKRRARYVTWRVGGTYTQEIDTAGWTAGMYIVEFRVDGRLTRKKLIVFNE
ncbi:MAG: T9SS type A sorting domain-containing protein [Bacteroidota bacterium]